MRKEIILENGNRVIVGIAGTKIQFEFDLLESKIELSLFDFGSDKGVIFYKSFYIKEAKVGE